MKTENTKHILEIGFTPLVATHPAYQTVYVETQVGALPGGGLLAKVRGAVAQGQRLLAGALDTRCKLVVCRSFSRFMRRRELSTPANALRYAMYWFIRFCVWLRVRHPEVQLVVLDWDDEAVIFRRDRFLLDRCSLYFKRELPQNAWNAFKYLQPPHQEPIMEFTSNPRFLPLLAKLRPVPLGIAPEKVARIERCLREADSLEKTSDVFFAGRVSCSTVRMEGLAQLEALRARGWRVDVPTEGLPFEEFVRRMAQSWLVWSPEGGGWDCFRHYEICVAGAVPLINYPTVQRYRPLLDGVHCVFYGVEEGGLARVAEKALADKERLRTMGRAAREHVLTEHTYPRLAQYIVESAGQAGGGTA